MRPLLRIAAILAFSVAAISAEDLKLPADWPPSWAEAYRRYEQFLADKKTYFPKADVDINEGGGITSRIKWAQQLTEHLNFDSYKDGLRHMPVPSTDRSINIEDLPPGKKYPLVAISCGLVSYQYLYPFIWFETEDKETFGSQTRRIARMTSPPKDPEAYWPYERLFAYRDFTTFPTHYRDDLFYANNKVTPWIKLEVAQDGTIHRQRLAPEMEKHLRWRIYRDDSLIEKGPVAASAIHPSPGEVGEYHVFLGIEGPRGFMPVSNELVFPLFPDGSGGLCVFPKTDHFPKIPDFLIPLLQEDALVAVKNEIATEERPKAVYWQIGGSELVATKSPSDRRLTTLWRMWNWELNHSVEGDGIVRIRKDDLPKFSLDAKE